MKKKLQRIIDFFDAFQNSSVKRIARPHACETGSLEYWRARILFSILFAALFLGTLATISGIAVAVKENA